MPRVAIKQLLRSTTATVRDDFLGIASITNKDVAGKPCSSMKPDEIKNKFSKLFVSRYAIKGQQIFQSKNFGAIRLDSDNVVTMHGQHENEELVVNKEDLDEYMRQDIVENDLQPQKPVLASEANPEMKVIEQKPRLTLKEVLETFDDNEDCNVSNTKQNMPPLYFEFKHAERDTYQTSQPRNKRQDVIQKRQTSNNSEYEETDANKQSEHPEREEAKEQPHDPTEDEIFGDLSFDKNIHKQYKEKIKEPEPLNASEYLNSVKDKKVSPVAKNLKEFFEETNHYPMKTSVTLDSKGFNVYTHQVPNWSKCLKSEIISHLKSCIIYNNYDILAINKPYGLASHKSSDEVDIDSLMQELTKSLRLNKLYLAHRLDKNTTGVLLFSTSQTKADKLNKLFKSGQVKKTYWCIVKGQPRESAAIIDIPIGENRVDGKLRSCPVPQAVENFKQLTPKFSEASRAITEYKVLKYRNEVSLVEAYPRTGVKHQIRCHFGLCLRTPILGDDKYSHLENMLPQRLSSKTLQALRLRPEKVRTLPMHLHSKRIVIPGAKANKEDLFIHAPLPDHFTSNMKSLGLLDREMQGLLKN